MALTPEQTQQLQKTIEQRRTALITEVSQDLEKVRGDRRDELIGAPGDAGDESVASLIADLEQAEASREVRELRTLEAARERLAEGSYGTCVDCGMDIGFARLQATPAAERCIHCQTVYEKTHAQPGGTSL